MKVTCKFFNMEILKILKHGYRILILSLILFNYSKVILTQPSPLTHLEKLSLLLSCKTGIKPQSPGVSGKEGK